MNHIKGTFKKLFIKSQLLYFKRKTDGLSYISDNKNPRKKGHLCDKMDLDAEEAIKLREWIDDVDLIPYDISTEIRER